MPWPNSGSSAARATVALQDKLRHVFAEDPQGLYSVDHLVSKTHADTIEQLVLAIDALIKEGLVQRLLKVESPTTGIGLGRYYASVFEIPERIVDTATGEEIDVEPDQIRQLFRRA